MGIFQTIILTYILGFGLQSFAIVFGIYTFNRQKLVLKSYLLSSLLMTIISGLVRLLPISIGVHTIINMLFLYLVCVILMKMSAYTTIKSTSICVVLILVCEMVLTSIIVAIKGNSYFERIMFDAVRRASIGVLANVIFVIIIGISYYGLKKKGDQHRNISETNSL